MPTTKLDVHPARPEAKCVLAINIYVPMAMKDDAPDWLFGDGSIYIPALEMTTMLLRLMREERELTPRAAYFSDYFGQIVCSDFITNRRAADGEAEVTFAMVDPPVVSKFPYIKDFEAEGMVSFPDDFMLNLMHERINTGLATIGLGARLSHGCGRGTVKEFRLL